MRRTLKIKSVILLTALLCSSAWLLEKLYAGAPTWPFVLYGMWAGVLLSILSSWAAE